MIKHAIIASSFWSSRIQVNATKAIFHQWKMLEASGCIENFRIAAGLKEGLREGWFFSDSDAYKWLDAAARIYATTPTKVLKTLMDEFVLVLSRAQSEDGYLYTYNQIHFPASRWENLLVEHELYCLGHLIEACISFHEATGDKTTLSIGLKAADLLVETFLASNPSRTDGHEEIEIALLRLYQSSGHTPYLDLARSLLEKRGSNRPFFPLLLSQFASVENRKRIITERRQIYLTAHPEFVSFRIPEGNYSKAPKNSRWRWMLSSITGKYFQMHTPIKKQTIPVGHCVRFGYLNTALAMLARLISDQSLLPSLEKSWDQMVACRMYVTGGLGAVPGLEGFGRDNELDPEYAYAETCAALACIFWDWQMAQITCNARYSDLLEWQLYNAAAPGMGLQGDTYLYNNPLACRQDIIRRPWFSVPCCPSNLSRTWASLGEYIFSFDVNNIWVHQYIGSIWTADPGNQTDPRVNRTSVEIDSALPWSGKVRVLLDPKVASKFTLQLRIPSWAGEVTLSINQQPISLDLPLMLFSPTASGYDPRRSSFLPVTRTWFPGDIVELEFEMPLLLRRASPKVRGHKGKVAITRGPLVYCLESVDNNDIDIFSILLDTTTLQTEFSQSVLGGTQIILARTTGGQALTFIPYFLWANRGQSQMTVWVNAS
jgi:DUF1680 family protein